MTNDKAIEIIKLQVEGLQPFADVPVTAEVIVALGKAINALENYRWKDLDAWEPEEDEPALLRTDMHEYIVAYPYFGSRGQIQWYDNSGNYVYGDAESFLTFPENEE